MAKIVGKLIFFTTKENGKWEQWRQIFILDKVKGVFS